MKSRLFFLPLLVLALASPLLSQKSALVWPKANLNQSEQEFLKQAYDATVLVYTQNDGGDLIMACTATAVLKNDKGYFFLTAGHCMHDDLVYYLSDDKQDPKTFFKVDFVACGVPAEGADFCLMHITTDREFPVVAVGASPESVAGEPAASVSSPLGLGKQTFRGFIATPHLKRPVTVRDKDNKVNKDKADDKDKAAPVVGRWYDYTLFQMPGVNSASSGSALLCMNQRAICGVVVGIFTTDAGTEAVALPINIVVEKLEGSALVYRTAPKPKADKK